MVSLKQKRFLLPLAILLVVYCCFAIAFKQHSQHIAEKQLKKHAQIVTDDLWNLNSAGASEYLRLAARSEHYQNVIVTTDNDELFYQLTNNKFSFVNTISLKIGLIKGVPLRSKIKHRGQFIGNIEVLWIPQTISIFLITAIVFCLIYVVIFLYLQILEKKEQLEKRVTERTSQLQDEKTRVEQINTNLEKATAEVEALLDNSPVGILCVDFNRTIQRVNYEVTRITGYSEDELIGNTTEMLYDSKQLYQEYGNANYPQLMENGFCQANSEIRHKDGSTIMTYWRGQIITANDELQGAVWSLEDVSLRMEMEEELQKVRSLESVGVLAGGIAHDFNNILVAILGNISLAEKLAETDERLVKLLTAAKKASLRAKDLTSKLLTFASGGAPVKAIETLPELLKDSASFVLSGSNVKCSFSLPEDTWPVNMDKTQINQVIQNLVLNADQAMPDGGILSVRCENTHLNNLHFTGLPAGNYVRITVKDNGIGIPQENLNKVFEPFYSSKKKDANKGSGLGLSIVHSIILKHGGHIQVHSHPGEGTTFTIYLPAILDKPHLSIETKAVTKGEGRILIMDDEEIIRNVASEMLEHLGYSTTVTVNGEETITEYRKSIAEGRKYDAVIMDLTIPGGMGGVTAIAELKKIDPEVKAIVSSGYSQDSILDDYKKYGFCDLISKPYQIHEVSQVLATHLIKT